jgi:hypothetical protein
VTVFFTVNLVNNQTRDGWRILTAELEDKIAAHSIGYTVYRTDHDTHQSIRFVFEMDEKNQHLKKALWHDFKWYEENWDLRIHVFKIARDADWENRDSDWES